MKLNKSIAFLGVLLVLASCAKKLTETDLPKVKREKTQDLIDVLDSLSKDKPQTFYTKISTKYEDSTQSRSFKTSLRMVLDSALNMIVTWNGIPVANALITPDSLLVVNKREKCVVRTDMVFIQENFGVDFSFANIEELLMGVPLDFDTTQKYFQIHEPFQYVIASHKKRKMKRNERLMKEDRDVAISYIINRDASQLDGIRIISATDSTTITISYLSRQFVGGKNVPNEVKIHINTPRQNLLIEMSYTKPEVNEPQEMYFIVPEGYEVCE